MSAARRATVTGVGVLSPLGCDYASFASAVHSGTVSEAAPLPGAESGELARCHLLSDQDVLTPHLSKRENEPLSALAAVCVGQALEDAGLPRSDQPRDDIGLVMNTVLGPSAAVESYVERLQEKGPRAARPAHFVDTLLSMPASRVGIALGLRGSTAVLGGSGSLEVALEWIRSGREHTLVAGGGDYEGPKCLRYFREMTARSGAERPLLAQGAAFFVLEESEHARERGAKPKCELRGAGAASEPQEIALPWTAEPECRALATAMHAALADAELAPEAVAAISLAAGDDTFEASELAAVRTVFGDHAESLSHVRPKRLLGETLGASSGMGILATLAEFHESGRAEPAYAVVNAFEMGGGATSLVLEVPAE